MDEKEIKARCVAAPVVPVSPNRPQRGTGRADGVIFFGGVKHPRVVAKNVISYKEIRKSLESRALLYLAPMDEVQRKLLDRTLGTSSNHFLKEVLKFQNPEMEEEADAAGVPLHALFVTRDECVFGHQNEHNQKWIVRKVEPGIWAVIYDKDAGEVDDVDVDNGGGVASGGGAAGVVVAANAAGVDCAGGVCVAGNSGDRSVSGEAGAAGGGAGGEEAGSD